MEGLASRCDDLARRRFLVTSMQRTPAARGWRLSRSAHANDRLSRQSRSLSWSHDGHWLATSGADACVVWPFKEKDGPMGSAAGMRRQVVAGDAGRVPSARPRRRNGYADGLILLCRLGAREILVRAPGDGAVNALGWTPPARACFWARERVAGLSLCRVIF